MIYSITPPLDPGLDCHHCGSPLHVTGRLMVAGMVLDGIQRYEITHKHGSDMCRHAVSGADSYSYAGVTNPAMAVQRIEAALSARAAVKVALAAALEVASS
jgi:hypothetical protein